MAHYIPKDALVAEIERRRDLHYKYYMKNGAGSIAECKYDEDRYILSFLDTLEVKEVDLDKEIIDWWNVHYSIKGYTFEGLSGHYLENSTVIEIAKHFFELGMAVNNKAQKGG